MHIPKPTELKAQELIEFQHLYKKHFDIELDEIDAMNNGIQLLHFIRNLLLQNQDLQK